jgi:predicted DNA-binding transcriptional regulator YafY
MPSTKHDSSLAFRLSDILRQLNSGAVLDPQTLAAQFNTSPRTIHRDLTEQLAGKEMLFAELEKAIRDCKQITFIPNVRIISPKELQPMLEAELRGYLDR